MECDICFEDVTHLVKFNCGHAACVVCTPKLKRCPWCTAIIENEPVLPVISGHYYLCVTVIVVIIFICIFFSVTQI